MNGRFREAVEGLLPEAFVDVTPRGLDQPDVYELRLDLEGGGDWRLRVRVRTPDDAARKGYRFEAVMALFPGEHVTQCAISNEWQPIGEFLAKVLPIRRKIVPLAGPFRPCSLA